MPSFQLSSAAEAALKELEASGRTTIKPGVKNMIGLLVLSVLIVLAGVVAIILDAIVIGIVLVLFGLVGTAFTIMRMVGRGNLMVLDESGVTARDHSVRWQEIDGVGLVSYSGQQFPVLQLTEAGRERMQQEAGWVTQASAPGAEGGMTLNNQMQISPEEILALVAHGRELHTGQPGPPLGTDPGLGHR